ncbi:hypothetical protein M9435_001258 [Picochlorum sp. BPE23]|nr:hypothetical protein M9435_001258 [Picochlorum sp. BPE23]
MGMGRLWDRVKQHMLWTLFPIWYTHFTQGLQTTLPYVIGVYMVRDFLSKKEEVSEKEVGFLTGVLGATFCFAQTLTSFLLGKLSDRVGRKPIIVLGNVSCAVFVLLFGLSGNFVHACVTRLCMGATNGIIGAEKAVIGEGLPRKDQSEAIGYISMTWGLGTLVGPMIGGVLAHPCGFVTEQNNVVGEEGDMACEDGSLLARKPFFLPCLAASLLSVVAVFLTAVFLEETLPSKQKAGYEPVALQEDPETGHDGRVAAMYKKNSDLFRYQNEVELSGTIKSHHHTDDGTDTLDEDNNNQEKNYSVDPGQSAADDASHPPWYKQRAVQLSLTGYALIAFCYIILDELVPIFASAPLSEGGLAFSPSKLSGPLSFGGIVLIVWMLVGYKWMSKHYGTIRTCIYGLYMTLPTAMMFPLSSVGFLNAEVMLWTAVTFKYIAGTNAFTACIVLVNLAAPKESLGEVNGLGQTLASGVRALGPFLGGVMWASSIRLFAIMGNAWGHQFVPFALSALVAFCTLFIYYNIDISEE